MFNLIRAEFRRMLDFKGFYIYLILSFLIGSFFMNEWGTFSSYEVVILYFTMLYGFLASPFISLFVCRDHHDGTIRNKIIAGHSRSSILIAEYIVCFAAAMIIYGVYWTHVFINMKSDNGQFSFSSLMIIKFMLCCVLITAVYTALIVTAAMLIGSRASAVVWTLISLILLVLGSSLISSMVETDAMERIKKDIGFYDVDEEALLSDTEREICVFFDDLLPFNQSMQLEHYVLFANLYDNDKINYGSEFKKFHEEKSKVCRKELIKKSTKFLFVDAAFIAVITAFGVFFFRRKSLK